VLPIFSTTQKLTSFTNYNSIPPTPHRAELGLPTTIPSALVGTVDEDPGEWALLVMKMNFKVARAGHMLKTNNLKLLHGRSQLRELTLRVTNWSPERLYDQIESIHEAFENIRLVITPWESLASSLTTASTTTQIERHHILPQEPCLSMPTIPHSPVQQMRMSTYSSTDASWFASVQG
jgi:hypothetical protein